jgi:hypothetical protein
MLDRPLHQATRNAAAAHGRIDEQVVQHPRRAEPKRCPRRVQLREADRALAARDPGIVGPREEDRRFAACEALAEVASGGVRIQPAAIERAVGLEQWNERIEILHAGALNRDHCIVLLRAGSTKRRIPSSDDASRR